MTEKEKNFVSAVVYVRDNEKTVTPFLEMLHGELDSHFLHYEIVCVNDSSSDGTAQAIRDFAHAQAAPVTIVQMSSYHGIELAMNAGMDISIGDFVFEFDTVQMPYEPSLLMECYRRSLSGCDIVFACPSRSRHPGTRLFYRLFNSNSPSAYRLRSDAFRVLSRRALNRVHAISATPAYRKAAYAASGLKLGDVIFEPLFNCGPAYKDPYEKALDSLVLYTNFAYRLSLGISAVLLLITIIFGVWTLVVFISPYQEVEGWTTTMALMCVGFFGVFLLLTIIIKYLCLLLDLVFKKQRYLVEGIEKI